jgi:hypothetical protein
MAATVEQIQNKINLYYNSQRMTKYSNSGKTRLFNYEPFSIRKTATTLEQIFGKISNNFKSIHNRKYLQSFFPYYVFYDVILDINGKIVLYVHKRNFGNAYSNKRVFYVQKDFYNKYKEDIDNIHINHGGALTNLDYRAELVIENIEDIYFLFHKQYTFDSITQRKEFKDKLLDNINVKLFNNKVNYVVGDTVEVSNLVDQTFF